MTLDATLPSLDWRIAHTNAHRPRRLRGKRHVSSLHHDHGDDKAKDACGVARSACGDRRGLCKDVTCIRATKRQLAGLGTRCQ